MRPVFLVLLLAALLAPAAVAQGPLSFTTVDLPAVTHDIALAGSFAYVATDTGLTVLDLAVPETPTPRGSVTAGKCQNVEVSGTRAYLACTTALKIVDISDPDAPQVIGTRTLPYAWDVAVNGTIVYVSSIAGELYVVDASTPSAPRVVRTIGLIAWRSPAGDEGNIQKLRARVTAGSAKATGVSIVGHHLFTVDWGYGRLYYYDVSVAANPVFAGTHYVPYVLKAVADPARDVVYMLSAYGRASGIYTVPLSSLSPDVASSHATCNACRYLQNTKVSLGIDQGGLALAPGGHRLFYGGGRHLGEFHVVDVATLQHLATTDIGLHRVGTANIMNGEARDDLIYFAAGALGVHVYHWPGL